MTKRERKQVVRKLSVSFVLAAALAVLLAGTALAAVIGVPQTLQEWFGRQWTEAGGGEMPEEQSAIIESLVQPVGVTTINKGVSVTLDSVTPGEGGLWLMYKVKADVLEEKWVDQWFFEDMDLGGRLMEKEVVNEDLGVTIHSGGDRKVGVTEDGSHVILMFFNAPKGVNFLEGGDVELRLSGLAVWGSERDEKTGEILQDGTVEAKWILPFTLSPTEHVEALTVKSAKVPCHWNELVDEGPRPSPLEIKDIRVTAMGISFLEPAWKSAEERQYVTSDVALQLNGGIEIKTGGGALGAMDPGEPHTRSWELPVDLSKVEAVRFEDVVIPLKQSKS